MRYNKKRHKLNKILYNKNMFLLVKMKNKNYNRKIE